jgi:hypothetical protein
MRNGTDLKRRNVLIADRSGEDYRSVADDPSISAEFIEVRRADTITVLVNGELLLDLNARHNTRHEIIMILQGLLNGDAVSTNQQLSVVLTKFDVIQNAAAADRERAERDFGGLVTQIKDLFGQSFREIRSFRIAASPATTTLPVGFGVSDLLGFWADPTVAPSARSFALPKSARAMGRFGATESGSGA